MVTFEKVKNGLYFIITEEGNIGQIEKRGANYWEMYADHMTLPFGTTSYTSLTEAKNLVKDRYC